MSDRLVTKNVTINGHRTSLRLQLSIWDALNEICKREGQTLNDLCSSIDERMEGGGRTAAVRAFVVTYFRNVAIGSDSETYTHVSNAPASESRVQAGLSSIGQSYNRLRRELARMLGAKNGKVQLRQKDIVMRTYRLRADLFELLSEIDPTLTLADPLTALPSRKGMQARLEQEMTALEQSEIPCSVAAIDVDHLGFVTGSRTNAERIIAGVAQCLVDNCRREDILARHTGAEFLMLLPKSNPDKAKRNLDRLRRLLARTPIRLDDGSTISVTASFGVAPMFHSIPIDVSIQRAEQALAEAKELGRNRVRIWDPMLGDNTPPKGPTRSLYHFQSYHQRNSTIGAD